MRRGSRRGRGAAARSRAGGPGGSPTTLTGRGGIVVIFAAGLVGALLSRWLDWELPAGAGFVAGCVLAVLTTRPADLLTLVVSPPLVFLAATVLAEFLTTLGQGSMLRGVTVGVLTSLATTAPWLFLGTLLVLLLSLPRGLPANVRELRAKLARTRLFEEEENENPVRWDESPDSPRDRRRLHHGEVD
ncbi:DUF6542 domain-containing protein [Actinomadura sp. NBRC 104425]|uniref:DUF6542 domain-containing protein n=1 Tax=Actinomadura sp. NBRC 104425 TaxID=3032204 RepID=UPI0025522EA9|nr:DUF6542 domain-containing protein [Actinomadura sp. NBRC 104425]